MAKEKMNTTIIYYTDNKLDNDISQLCQRKLVEASGGKPIISVSQKPMRLGLNINMGEIGSNWLNIYKQLYEGVRWAKTEYVATAEHDCLYTSEHYNWVPKTKDTFYYNENVYFVQWGGNHPELNGMYSTYWTTRCALSQLICDRELLERSLKRRLELLDGDKVTKQLLFAGEPGVTQIKEVQKWAKSGKPVHLYNLIKDHLESEKSDIFRTEVPNLDIRHSNNFTGPKRGKNRCYELPYWGRFVDII